MATPLYLVDAFSERPFTGNQSAVCLPGEGRDTAWLQALACELNLPETAFVVPQGDGFGLRWFSPQAEVALCGHATLAAAHVLWESGRLAPDAAARFHTLSGVLTVVRRGKSMVMDFPAEPAALAAPPPGLTDALGCTPLAVARNRFDYLVEVASAAIVRELAPDFARLRTIETRGVIVTAVSDTAGVDFVSRFFAPALGIDEDPVTGSAHCALGPYWGERLGRTRLTGRQLSPRGGEVGVELLGERVMLSGRAVTVLRGELAV